jgi:hypothetical protein
VKFLNLSMFSILVLFSLCTYDLRLFELQKDQSSFNNFKFHHTILQHHVGLRTSFYYCGTWCKSVPVLSNSWQIDSLSRLFVVFPDVLSGAILVCGFGILCGYLIIIVPAC